MKPELAAQATPPPGAESPWLPLLKSQAALLDGIEVAMCAFDAEDRAVLWNRTFLRLFPEHDGRIAAGEHYRDNLRRFYEARLDAAEMAKIDSYIQGGVERHRAQTQPFEFEHRGKRVQVSSLPSPGFGRVRVWRVLGSLPAAPAADTAFAADLGSEMLEYVPEALGVCGRDGRLVWANARFCALFGVAERSEVLGATLEETYARAWAATAGADPCRDQGRALLRENLRFAGAPFELPLPDDVSCRVVARPAGDGAVFYALIDISALKSYEAALQLTLDNAGRGIIRYDAEGRIQLFNRQALQLLDLPEKMFDRTPRIGEVVQFQQERGDFVPEDQAGLAPALQVPASAPFDHFRNHQYLRRTRAGRVLEIATRTLPDGGAVRTYTDVTEYFEAQRALTEKTDALQITLDSMSQGITVIDHGGNLAFWNRRYQELLELPDELLVDKPSLDQIVRFQTARGDFGPNFEYVDAVARGYVAVGDRLGPLKGPESYVRKTRDGRSFDVTTRPLPDGGVVRTFTDITAHVRTQEALAYKQAQLGALVDNLPDRVWLRDLEGMFLLSNPAHQRYHGRTEAEIVGHTALEVFGPERAERQAETDQRALESATPISFEFSDLGPDGSPRFAEVVKVAMRDDAGNCIGLLGIARDITRRKRAEAGLIKAKEEALEASGAKSRFLSSMSHEIRTPMNAVLGMLTLLRASELAPHQDDYAGKAEGAARALLSLLNDILDFSKIEAGKMRLDPRPFSLESMLSELSVILSSNVGGKELEVLYDLDPRVPDGLVGDDMRLRQILINLGGNAVKFTERGEVVVRTRLVALEEGHASVEFAVQDSGIGISPEQQQRLFGDYVQATDETARQFGGTGLGLGICRRLTELMESSLQLESAPGAGSRFWFTVRLPVSGVQAPAASPREEHPRVLIVDDNPVARDTLAALARAAGWQADTAEGGRQALARITTAAVAGQAYDTVFVDWVMPGMDGWQTCSRIRALPLEPRMPLVVMVTAHGREMLDGRPEGERALLDGFLVKPVTTGMLRAALVRPDQPGQAPVGAAAAAASPQPLAGVRLLLAEDNPVNQQIATELLARRGAQIDVAENGRIAVDKLAAGTRYDAVLMDVQMPVMDGIEATRQLRLRFDARALPIIAMTANAMDTDRQACFAAGMNAHVAKPFVIEEVVATILRCVGSPMVLDRVAALARLGGDQQLLDNVLVTFRENLEDAARTLAAADATPVKDLARLLHSIKGMAGNLAAQDLAQVAAAAEARLRSGEAGSPAEAVAEVRGTVAQVLRELESPAR